jgi:uncharacterized lipoprotein YajG
VVAEKLSPARRVFTLDSFKEIAMRPVIVVLLACLTLTACGSSRRTVIVNPPPDSTTVVERDGTAHVIPN